MNKQLIFLFVFGCCLFAGQSIWAQNQYTNLQLQPRWIDLQTVQVDHQNEDGQWETLQVDAATGRKTVRGKGKEEFAYLNTNPNPRPRQGSSPRIQVEFINQTKQPIETVWIDFEGNEVSYGLIKAGQSRNQSTFVGHAWKFYLVDSDQDDAAPEAGKETERSFLGSAVAAVFPKKLVLDKTTRSKKQPDTSSRRKKRPARKRSRPSLPRIEGAKGQRQSEDGRFTVYWKTQYPDQNLQQTHWIDHSSKAANKSDHPMRAQMFQSNYVLPGEALPVHTLYVHDAETNESQKLDCPPIDWGRPQIHLLGNRTLLVEKVDRGHQRYRLWKFDLSDGNKSVILDQQTETFIWSIHEPPVPKLQVLDQNTLIHANEASGFRHLYRIDLSEDEPIATAITKGNWLVRNILHIDKDNRTIDIEAGGFYPDQDPYHRHVLRVSIDDGSIVPLTDGDGDHDLTFSPDRSYAVDRYCRVDLPPVYELRRCSDGKKICKMTSSSWWGESNPPQLPIRFSAKGRDGKTDIWGIACLPPAANSAAKPVANSAAKPKSMPTRSVPIIESIYAGPHGAFVPKKFRGSSWNQEWTDMGMALVQIDGMGTARRGKAFHDVCWKNLKDSGFPDRIAWIRKLAEAYPALDTDRVGIFGTSAGGQSAAAAVIHHGDFYKAARASCGCHDNRMDKASWNEQWMGYPVDDSYVESSNIENASKLSGKLFLIVGDVDRNVPPESTMRFVDALIAADKDFELLVMPGRGHTDGGTYGRRRTRDFFRDAFAPSSE